MTIRMRLPLAAATSAILTLGLLGLGAPAALADEASITTATTEWTDIDLTTGSIGDAASYSPSLNSTGYSFDAFDTFGTLQVVDSVAQTSWRFEAEISTQMVVADESSVFVLSGTDPSGLNAITLTLSLEGNFARWSYLLDGPDVANYVLNFAGELGSWVDTVSVVEGNTAYSHDGYGGDPVIAYEASSDGTFDGWTFDDAQGTTIAAATGAQRFEITVALVHFNLCGYRDALATAEALHPTVADSFGASLAEEGTCFSGEPVTLKQGVAVDQIVPTTAHELIFVGAYEDFEWSTPQFPAAALFVRPLPDEVSYVETVTGLPAGLRAEALWSNETGLSLRLNGTPSESGTFAVTVAPAGIDHFDGEGRDEAFDLPATVTVTVAAPDAITPATPEKPKVLAESGTEMAGLVQASLLVLSFGGLLVAYSRRREAKRR